MNHQFESSVKRKLNITIFLLFLSLLSTGLFAYLWQNGKKEEKLGFSQEVFALPFNDTEQIDPVVARNWGIHYDTIHAKGNTIGVSFLLSDFVRIVREFSTVKNPVTRNFADRVFVKFIAYDSEIGKPQYGKDPTFENRISVTFWPYCKKDSAIIDDGTPNSRPLNLGDLHP